jgi:hypothetical protein
MTDLLRRVLVLTSIALIATAAVAAGESVKTAPAKGATYRGLVHSETISIKVASNGKTAKVSLPIAPGFCQGGSGPQKQSSKPGAISKGGVLIVKIGYSAVGGHTTFATATVKGNFFTFGKSTPVFQGTVKSSFAAAGSRECDGQESFEATKTSAPGASALE